MGSELRTWEDGALGQWCWRWYTLLLLGAVPIINENDTVATDEIRYGDNDRLAARTAQMIGSDTLILLTDIDGLYTSDPRVNTNAQHRLPRGSVQH
mgnify:CR=1 FL=1